MIAGDVYAIYYLETKFGFGKQILSLEWISKGQAAGAGA